MSTYKYKNICTIAGQSASAESNQHQDDDDNDNDNDDSNDDGNDGGNDCDDGEVIKPVHGPENALHLFELASDKLNPAQE